MSPLRMAVIGVGALGRHHARILSELESAELVAVVELNAAAGKTVAEQCGTRWVDDYRKIIDDVDAVSIVVPTTAHLSVASDFLEREIPVLVEKPLARTAEEAQQLVDLANARQTLMQVGHVERFNPATQTAWEYCRNPKYIRAERLSPYAFRSTDIGVVHDLMIHDLDLVLELAESPVRDVQAFGFSILGGHEDSVQARVCFENGCIADLTANRVSPTASRQMQIWSERGVVNVDFASRDVACFSPSETLLFGTSPLERAKQPDADIEQLKQEIFGKFIRVNRPATAETDALTAELSSFIDCVQSNQQPLIDGKRGLAAMILADRVVECVNKHQWDGHAEGPVGPCARPTQRRKLAG